MKLVTCPDCKGQGTELVDVLLTGQQIKAVCAFCNGQRQVPASIRDAAAGVLQMRSVDFVARLAEAWDGAGRQALAPPTDHEALCCLARLPLFVSLVRWRDLNGDQRQKLVFAARRAVELGKTGAWIFGEGRGA